MRRIDALALSTLVALVALSLVACQPTTLRLDVPSSHAERGFICSKIAAGGDGTGAAAVKCSADPKAVPSDDNQFNTLFVNLPRECDGRFSQIIIRDLDTYDPKVHVKCAGSNPPILEKPPVPESASP